MDVLICKLKRYAVCLTFILEQDLVTTTCHLKYEKTVSPATLKNSHWVCVDRQTMSI